jgi:hypothetical protein
VTLSDNDATTEFPHNDKTEVIPPVEAITEESLERIRSSEGYKYAHTIADDTEIVFKGRAREDPVVVVFHEIQKAITSADRLFPQDFPHEHQIHVLSALMIARAEIRNFLEQQHEEEE